MVYRIIEVINPKAADPGGPGASQTRTVVKGAGKSWEVSASWHCGLAACGSSLGVRNLSLAPILG